MSRCVLVVFRPGLRFSRAYFRVPESLLYSQLPSDAEDSDSQYISISRELGLEDSPPSGGHLQDGGVHEQGNANLSDRIKEPQTELQVERSRYEERIANLEDELKGKVNSSSTFEELQRQSQDEIQCYVQRIAVLEDELRIYADSEIAAQAEEIQKLVKQLELAEHQNSHDFAGGESFLDSGATPHLLNKAVERVYQTSGNFTKLLMPTLKNGGVDCTKVAKALATSVSFERPAHTKFVYQALVCNALFTDFDSVVPTSRTTHQKVSTLSSDGKKTFSGTWN